MFLKPQDNGHGYLKVALSKSGKVSLHYIHKLVSEAYIPNPLGLSQINHKDEIKSHNYVNNLEWATVKENINYGTRTAKTQKPIYCIELDKAFNGVREAARELGISSSGISSACSGKQKTCGGYHWEYWNGSNKS